MDSEKINTAHRPFEALEIGAFRWFVAYRFFFTFGLQMLATIAGWQIWAMTHSKIQLGYAGLVEAIPSIGMALYAGHIADKYARKKVALGAMIFIQLSVLGLLIGFWLGRDLSFSAFIFAALFGVGFGRSFMAAASFASLGTLIPKEKMSNAVSWRIAGERYKSSAMVRARSHRLGCDCVRFSSSDTSLHNIISNSSRSLFVW